MGNVMKSNNSQNQIILTGPLSGKTIKLPQNNEPPMPAIAASGMNYHGKPIPNFHAYDNTRVHPNVRSFKRKFGLLIPATNTTMEHELWSLIFRNNSDDKLNGVGIHTTNVLTPSPKLESEEDLVNYQRQFLTGLKAALDESLLAQPEYLLLGMSLEHIIYGLDAVRAPITEIEKSNSLSWATWQDAAPVALKKFNAKRIGLISPFDAQGNRNAVKLFEDLGFDVITSFGFSCAHAAHIAHIPDAAKEKVILELLATSENKLDAIVQCGTNMGMLNVIEKLEPMIGIPIIGINPTILWYALRETGITCTLAGGGKLLKHF